MGESNGGLGACALHQLLCIHQHSLFLCTKLLSRVEKEKFMNDLQQAMDAIPPGECYVIMGDLNVRVGFRLSEGDQWTVEMKDDERELLTFLATNKATLCSTWFQKIKFISTLQHPKMDGIGLISLL